MEGTKIYRLWSSMLTRCRNPKSPTYKRHGARGITVCDRWLKFENFYADMGERPQGMQLERQDNNGPYSPENCVWATVQAQALNRRNNRLVTINGVTRPCSVWAAEAGLSQQCLSHRLKAGWPEHLLLVPNGAGLSNWSKAA
jgi:hypothetical protein